MVISLTAKQSADYARLHSYYPYRRKFLVQETGASEAVIWAPRDMRPVNEALRNGATVLELQRGN